MHDEQRRDLEDSVRAWFAEPSQVEHYAARSDDGPSRIEEVALHALPPAPARILDVGCGAGRIARHLAAAGHEVLGVDVSAPLIRRAEQRAESHLRLSFRLIEGDRFPVGEAAFDAAVSIRSFGYIPTREARAGHLREIGRALAPGGVLVLVQAVVPSEDEALGALALDPEHRAAVARFERLDPLDTFSEGRGFVHWFTVELLLAELDGTSFSVRSWERSEDGLDLAVVLDRR